MGQEVSTMPIKNQKIMKIVFKLIIFLLIITGCKQGSSVHAQTTETKSELSHFKFNNAFGLITIPVTINESETLYFIVDTGFDVNVMNEETAVSLGFSLSEKISQAQPGGTIEYSVLKDVKLKINNETLSLENFIVTELGNLEMLIGQKIDGILGIEFLEKFAFAVNYETSRITMYNSIKDVKTKAYSQIPILLEEKEPFMMCQVTNANGKLVDAKFKMDTGGIDAIGYNKNYYEDNTLTNENTQIQEEKGAGVGGETQGVKFRTQKLTIGEYQLENVSSAATLESGGFENRDNAGTIGAELLIKFNWILDFKNQMVYLKDNSNFSKPFRSDGSGLWIIENDQKEKLVFQVIENSPAHKLGITAGSIVVEINGKLANTISVDEFWKLTRQKDGTTITLKLKDDSDVKTLVLKELI
jgi:predicted aspartyl protease